MLKKIILVCVVLINFSSILSAHPMKDFDAIECNKIRQLTPFTHIFAKNMCNEHTAENAAHHFGMVKNVIFFLEKYSRGKKLTSSLINQIQLIPFTQLSKVFSLHTLKNVSDFMGTTSYKADVVYSYNNLDMLELLYKFTDCKLINRVSTDIIIVPILKKYRKYDYTSNNIVRKSCLSNLSNLACIDARIATCKEAELLIKNTKSNFSAWKAGEDNILNNQHVKYIIFLFGEFFTDKFGDQDFTTKIVALNTKKKILEKQYINSVKENYKVKELCSEGIKLISQKDLLYNIDVSKRVKNNTKKNSIKDRIIEFVIPKDSLFDYDKAVAAVSNIGDVKNKRLYTHLCKVQVLTNKTDKEISNSLYEKKLSYLDHYEGTSLYTITGITYPTITR